MASKKLVPGARRLKKPPVRVRDTNPPVANEEYSLDRRSKADPDGNTEQARKRARRAR